MATIRLFGQIPHQEHAMHKFVWTTRVLILVLMLSGSGAIVWAQAPSLPASAVVSAAAEPAEADSVRLLVGRSAVLDVGSAITRVSLTSADIADALVTSPSQLLINGKMPGTISMFVWDRGGALKRYEVIVQRDLARLNEQVRTLFPGEKIDVQSNGKNVVLSGYVSNKDVIEKVVNVAAGYVDKKEEVTTLLQLQPNAASNQVLLRVRFAEVSRSALTELGASFFTSPIGVKNTLGRVTTQQFGAPGFDKLKYTKDGFDFGSNVTSAEGEFTFSDFLNLFLFSEKYDLGMMVKALQNRGLFQSLAEPNLVAESGKEASFLAGGEFPIPVAQGSGANIGVSVQFKEFGVRLNFTPTVVGDRVHLKVRPEVSALDFNNAITLGGFRIPSLTTRRTETEIELQNGQTFAIAGLINNTMVSSLQKVPGIGDIPILGLLFRSKAAQKNQTELVVMITPEILPNNSRGVTPNLPRMPERYLDPLPERRTMPQPPPAFGANRAMPDVQTANAQGPAASAPTTTAATTPEAAAATVSALTPAGPRTSTASAPAPAATALPTAVARQLTPQQQKAVERARIEDEKKTQERARLEAQAYARAQAVEGRRISEARATAEKASREQAKRDAEAAAKAQEAAKKQAERDREQQKAVEAAAARLKAAEAAYNAQVKKNNNNP
jgi:pilus assembly protein CpaC